MHHPALHPASLYSTIFDFIAGLGLPIAEAELGEATFLPGIAIRNGGLLVDPARLRWPGDLLHEAGHLAVLPPALRAAAHDDLPAADEHDAAHDHAGEQEALAWAWAAAMHLGLPPETLIHAGGYRGKSRELLQMYALGIYPGLRGLCALGMTSAPGFSGPETSAPEFPAHALEAPGVGSAGSAASLPDEQAPRTQIAGGEESHPLRYPHMHRWLRA